MAVIQKKTNELESMMASFAAIPDFEKAGTDPKKDKRLQEDKKKYFLWLFFINYQIAFCSFWQFFYQLLSKPCPLFYWEVSYLALSRSL